MPGVTSSKGIAGEPPPVAETLAVLTPAQGADAAAAALAAVPFAASAREVISTQWQHHLLIVGVIAILIVIFAPKGFVGLWRSFMDRVFGT